MEALRGIKHRLDDGGKSDEWEDERERERERDAVGVKHSEEVRGQHITPLTLSRQKHSLDAPRWGCVWTWTRRPGGILKEAAAAAQTEQCVCVHVLPPCFLESSRSGGFKETRRENVEEVVSSGRRVFRDESLHCRAQRHHEDLKDETSCTPARGGKWKTASNRQHVFNTIRNKLIYPEDAFQGEKQHFLQQLPSLHKVPFTSDFLILQNFNIHRNLQEINWKTSRLPESLQI